MSVKERVRATEARWAVRLRGRLLSGQRPADWRFGSHYEHGKNPMGNGAVYTNDLGDCWECPPCAGMFCGIVDERVAPPGAVALLFVASLVLIRRQRRARRSGSSWLLPVPGVHTRQQIVHRNPPMS